jgi:hypothetical protein
MEERFLLTPDGTINARILGWLGRAMKRFPSVRVYGVIVLANHLHLLVSSQQVDLDGFMGYWLGNVAKEVNRLRGKPTGKLFGRRYSASALLARNKLAYLLVNPTAAKLVADPAEWPGITSLDAQTGGPQLVGTLPDRAELKRRNKRGESVTEADVMVEYPIAISPLPEFEDCDIAHQGRTVRELVECELAKVNTQLEQENEGSGPSAFSGSPRFSPRIPWAARETPPSAHSPSATPAIPRPRPCTSSTSPASNAPTTAPWSAIERGSPRTFRRAPAHLDGPGQSGHPSTPDRGSWRPSAPDS